jgi:hypothetical protein
MIGQVCVAATKVGWQLPFCTPKWKLDDVAATSSGPEESVGTLTTSKKQKKNVIWTECERGKRILIAW